MLRSGVPRPPRPPDGHTEKPDSWTGLACLHSDCIRHSGEQIVHEHAVHIRLVDGWTALQVTHTDVDAEDANSTWHR